MDFHQKKKKKKGEKDSEPAHEIISIFCCFSTQNLANIFASFLFLFLLRQKW